MRDKTYTIEIEAVQRKFGGIWPGLIMGLHVAVACLMVLNEEWVTLLFVVGSAQWAFLAMAYDKEAVEAINEAETYKQLVALMINERAKELKETKDV